MRFAMDWLERQVVCGGERVWAAGWDGLNGGGEDIGSGG